MGRPKLADPPRPLHLHIPRSLADRIELRLFSTIEGRVPHSAWKEFAVQAFTRHIDALDAAARNLEGAHNGIDTGTEPTN